MINKTNKKAIAIIIVILAIAVLIILNINKDTNEIIIENTEDNITIETKEEPRKIIVHITGCINNPGVVEIKEGARIIDAIEMAGGITEEADVSKVNLAYIIKDAQKIYIPSVNDEDAEYISKENGNNVIVKDSIKGENAMININSATQTELEQLPGIGPSTALKIINYREKNGKFKSIEELKQVQGIGDAKFSNIKDMIEV